MSSVLHKLYGLPVFAQVVPEFDESMLPDLSETSSSGYHMPIFAAIVAGLVILVALIWVVKRRHVH